MTPAAVHLSALCATLLCLAVLQRGASAKVAFPDTPRSSAAAPAAPPPAAAPESRLLADGDAGFGLSSNLDFATVLGQARRRPDCPACHQTVYSYCGDRLLHDACCCLQGSYSLPPQCELADCSFLHAKSCPEHALITRCCCDRRLF